MKALFVWIRVHSWPCLAFDKVEIMEPSRRDLAILLPALAVAQEKKPAPTLESRVYQYPELPVKENGQNKGRAVLDRVTHGGFPVELHMTELGPGQAPHAPHQHAHEEI